MNNKRNKQPEGKTKPKELFRDEEIHEITARARGLESFS